MFLYRHAANGAPVTRSSGGNGRYRARCEPSRGTTDAGALTPSTHCGSGRSNSGTRALAGARQDAQSQPLLQMGRFGAHRIAFGAAVSAALASPISTNVLSERDAELRWLLLRHDEIRPNKIDARWGRALPMVSSHRGAAPWAGSPETVLLAALSSVGLGVTAASCRPGARPERDRRTSRSTRPTTGRPLHVVVCGR